MNGRTTNRDISKRQLRYFAWVVALGLAVLATFLESSRPAWPLQLAAALVFGVGTVLPRLLHWPYLLLLLILRPFIRFSNALRPFFLPPDINSSTDALPSARRMRRNKGPASTSAKTGEPVMPAP